MGPRVVTATGQPSQGAWRQDVILAMLRTIPPELWTEDVLDRIDLRTLLDPFVAKTDDPAEIEVNGQKISPEQQRYARAEFVDYSKKVIEDYQKDLDSAGIVGEEQLALIEEAKNAWRDNKGALVPVRINMDRYNEAADDAAISGTQPKTGTAGPAGTEFDISSINDDVAGPATPPPRFMSLDDYKLMFRDYDADAALGQYVQDLGGRQAYLADPERVGMVPLNEIRDPTAGMSMEGIGRGVGRTHADTSSLAGIQAASTYLGDYSGGLTLTEMKGQLAHMSREEISKLTDRMKKAGIFDQVGGEPTIKGDFDDPKLKQAWTTLLAKSLQSGKKPNELLDELALSYEEELADKVHTHVTDPALIRTSSDLMARKLIGRKLSKQEQAGLTKFILELERKENKSGVKAETDGGETTDIDWQAQMEEYITHQNPTEAAAKDVANAYDTFKGMLGPAGGSVS